jgi:Tetratricopeptide repeat
MMMGRIFSIALVGALLLSSAASANDSLKKAKKYFDRGELLFDEGEYSKAAQAFELAYERAPHPSVLANIAVSYAKAGNTPKALQYYEKYLNNEPEDEQATEDFEALISTVCKVVVSCPKVLCELSVDGVDQGEVADHLWLEPGTYSIEASDNRLVYDTIEVEAEPGARLVVEFSDIRSVEETDEEEVLTESELEDPADQSPISIFFNQFGVGFWVSTGVTGAAGILTIVLGARTLNDKAEFDDGGSTDKDLKEQGEQDKVATNVLLGITIAAAVAATGFAIYDFKFKKDGTEHEDTDAKIALTPGPGIGFGLLGSF